jgi:hypothetical protein
LPPGYCEYGKDKDEITTNNAGQQFRVGGHRKGDRKPFICAYCLPVATVDYPDCIPRWLHNGSDGKPHIWFRFLPGEVPIGHKATASKQVFGEWVEQQCTGDMPAPASSEHAGKFWRGEPKGLTQLFRELGLPLDMKRSTSKTSGEPSLDQVFDSQKFICDQPSLLARVIERKGGGHTCLMLPKCHPEFNPIERVWGRMKMYTRGHNDGKLPTLRANVPLALAGQNIPPRLHFEFERKSRDYYRAYLNSETTDPFVAEVHIRAQRNFRSHRGIPPAEYTSAKSRPWGLQKAAEKAKQRERIAKKVTSRKSTKRNKLHAVLTGSENDDDKN